MVEAERGEPRVKAATGKSRGKERRRRSQVPKREGGEEGTEIDETNPS